MPFWNKSPFFPKRPILSKLLIANCSFVPFFVVDTEEGIARNSKKVAQFWFCAEESGTQQFYDNSRRQIIKISQLTLIYSFLLVLLSYNHSKCCAFLISALHNNSKPWDLIITWKIQNHDMRNCHLFCIVP